MEWIYKSRIFFVLILKSKKAEDPLTGKKNKLLFFAVHYSFAASILTVDLLQDQNVK